MRKIVAATCEFVAFWCIELLQYVHDKALKR